MKRLFKRCAAIAVLSLSMLTIAPTITHADTVGDKVAPVVVEGSTITFSETGWTLTVQLVLPIVIGLLLKSTASKRIKAVVAAVASLVTAVLAQRILLPDGTSYVTVGLAFDAFVVWLGSQVWYNRLYSQFNLNSKLAPNAGIG